MVGVFPAVFYPVRKSSSKLNGSFSGWFEDGGEKRCSSLKPGKVCWISEWVIFSPSQFVSRATVLHAAAGWKPIEWCSFSPIFLSKNWRRSSPHYWRVSSCSNLTRGEQSHFARRTRLWMWRRSQSTMFRTRLRRWSPSVVHAHRGTWVQLPCMGADMEILCPASPDGIR